MARKDYILMLGLVTLSGLIGGSLTSPDETEMMFVR